MLRLLAVVLLGLWLNVALADTALFSPRVIASTGIAAPLPTQWKAPERSIPRRCSNCSDRHPPRC
ncbi:protein of unknown function [Pseudomonas mediterranea]